MTQTSRYWFGRSSQGSPGDSGIYSDDQFSEVLETEFGQNKANRGVLRGVDNELQVVASAPADTNVNVSTGAAFVQGRWYYNNASVPVAITSNSSGSTRIDIIVLEADYTAQTVRIAVVQGTPAAGLPSLTQTALIYQIPLAYLTLSTGYTSISNAAITDMREYANIPANVGVDITNSSGATLDSGSAVIWLAAGGAAIDDTTTPGHTSVAGVIEGRVANAAAGRIIISGIVSVLCDESVAVGDYLSTSSTSGQAQKNVGGRSFARVLAANTGAGTKCLAYVNVLIEENVPYDSGWFAVAASTTYTKAHGLPNAPRRVELWHSTTATPGAGDELVRVTHVSLSNAGNYTLDPLGVDATNVYVTTGAPNVAATGATVVSQRRISNTGFYRIYAWT